MPAWARATNRRECSLAFQACWHEFNRSARDSFCGGKLIDNLAAYFGRFAPQLLTASYGVEIWTLFEAGRLHADVELTGRIAVDTAPVNLEGVLQELEETRLEEDARVRRQQG
jgi:hypothetical protein